MNPGHTVECQHGDVGEHRTGHRGMVDAADRQVDSFRSAEAARVLEDLAEPIGRNVHFQMQVDHRLRRRVEAAWFGKLIGHTSTMRPDCIPAPATPDPS